MLRLFAIALGICTLVGCAGAPRPAPPPPPGFADLLPPDAPLTAVLRPAALRRASVDLGIGPTLPLPGPDLDIAAPVAGLGVDPDQPVWLSLRAGPVLGVLRAAEDAARVLADVDPLGDPRLAPGEPWPAGPFDRWLRAHPLPPAWLHLRMVGRPAQGPQGAPGAAVTPDAWLAATAGALAVARTSDPTETYAAALDAELGPAGAIQAALGGMQPTLYRLLDRPLPTVVVVHRRGGAEPATVVDVVWDLDLGPGGLAAGMAALPEAGGVWGPRRAAQFGWPAEDELARVGVHHAGWLAAGRMIDEVRALQAVVGQGPTPPGAARLLQAGRAEALRPQRMSAPAARALVETTAAVVRTARGVRVRLAASAPGSALARLRDGTAPIDHGVVADGLPARGPAAALTLAQPPAELARVLTPQFGPPDRPLPTLLSDLDRCGPRCLPALWSVLAHGRDLPATIAAISGHAPLDATLAPATGLAGVWSGDGLFAAAVGHRAPATLDRAAWKPVTEAAGLESRWVLGDRAVLLAGHGALLDTLGRAARSPAVTDAAVLRFTATGLDRVFAALRVDGALSFDRDGVAVDMVVDRRPAPP